MWGKTGQQTKEQIKATRVLSFEKWLIALNIIVRDRIGIGYEDLPDCPYSDWYEDGVSPLRAAGRAVKMAKGEDY